MVGQIGLREKGHFVQFKIQPGNWDNIIYDWNSISWCDQVACIICVNIFQIDEIHVEDAG